MCACHAEIYYLCEYTNILQTGLLSCQKAENGQQVCLNDPDNTNLLLWESNRTFKMWNLMTEIIIWQLLGPIKEKYNT